MEACADRLIVNPKRKKRPPRLECPLPVPIETLTGLKSSVATWPSYRANYRYGLVFLCHDHQANCVYSMGCFGKGAFSRGEPTSCASQSHSKTHYKDNRADDQVPIISKQKYDRHTEWMQASAATDQPPLTPIDGGATVVVELEQRGPVTMRSRCDWRIREDPFPVKEPLQLSRYEAMFLVYAIGCLTLIDSEDQSVLSQERMWNMWSRKDPNFQPLYAAYHHFRSKGWIPKCGLKYGCDFVLYKTGPGHYHSSYGVYVIHADRSDLGWTQMMGANRLIEQVGKELILCYVDKCANITPLDLQCPCCISKFNIKEVLAKRCEINKQRNSVVKKDASKSFKNKNIV